MWNGTLEYERMCMTHGVASPAGYWTLGWGEKSKVVLRQGKA